MITRRGLLVATLLTTACAGSGATEGAASPFSTARRDDIITVRAHNEILRVAAGERLVFALSQSGVVIYDAMFRRWLPPLDIRSDFRRTDVILEADPAEDAVWVGSRGEVLYYRPHLDYAVTTRVFGTPREIFFDRQDLGEGAYVTGAGVVRVSRTGSVTQVPPGEAPSAENRIPSPHEATGIVRELGPFLPLLTRDDDLEQWEVSAAIRTPGRREVWLGTSGNGLLQVDPTFNRAEQLPFGLVDSGVGALALAADGVWAGGLGRPGARGALVFASTDLQRWRWLDGPRTRPLAHTRVNSVAVRGHEAWIGTNRGLLRMDLEDDSRVVHWDVMDGLPSDAVSSIAVHAGGAWVGTTEGLAYVSATVRRIGPRVDVNGLAPWGDTLWIASSAGLFTLAPGDSMARRQDIADSRLNRPLAGVARTDSILVVATADADLVEIDLSAKRTLPPRAASVSSLRRIARTAVDALTIWLAGEGGVLVIERSTGRSTFLTAGSVLPAAATDVVLTRELAWVGTRDGLVRIRRRSDGMPP